MGFDSYKGSVKLGSGLTPQGGANFPLMQSCDILVDEHNKRLDTLLGELRELAMNGGPASGIPIPVSSATEMDDILASATGDSVGTIYKYTGTSTDTYENGALYIISDEIPDGDGVIYGG